MTDTPFLFNKLHLKTLSPLHIGEGRKLKAVDYILQEGWLYALDESKVIAWIAQDIRRASIFTAALSENPKQIRMKDILTHLGVDDWKQFVAYQVKVKAAGFLKDVAAFIKSADNKPYLPGSSIKGSLRGAWLRGLSIEDKSLQSKINQMVSEAAQKGKSASQDIESEAFTTPGVDRDKRSNYDINRLMQLRDSEPLSTDIIQVIEVKVISTTSDGDLRDKTYSIFIEALVENTQVELSIEWQTYLLDKSDAKLGFNNLLRRIVYLPEYCRAASLNIMAQERDFYSRHGKKELAGWFDKKLNIYSRRNDMTFPLPLGWGSGYDSKTITDLLDVGTFKEVVETYKYTQGLGKPGRNPAANWLGIAESPKSRKVAIRHNHGHTSYEPIGWVELSILPLNGQDGLSQMRSSIAEAPVFPQEMIQPSRGYPSKPTPELSRADRPLQESRPPSGESYQEMPTEKPVKERFTSLPKPGDQFYGVVFDVTESEVLLEIPGLDADSQAYAVLKAKDNPLLGRKKEKQRVLCEVLDLHEESKGYWQVRCRLG